MGNRHRPGDSRAALHHVEDVLGRFDRVRRATQHSGERSGHRAAWRTAGCEQRRHRACHSIRACDWREHQPAFRVRAQELFLPRPSQGLPDQPVRVAYRAGRRNINRNEARREKNPLDARTSGGRHGQSLHEDFHGMSGIDLNRAGTPLLEIVSEPDMRSAEEAVAYAKALHALVRWIDICDGNMQEGSFRCDANVSVRRPGAPLGTRAEIKNLNSFRFLERAIEYEAKRQIEILEDGGKIVQETRLYDPDRDETRSMRTKEEAHDYRYFPDPDLLPLVVTEEWIAEITGSLVGARIGLPQVKRSEYVHDYGLAKDEAVLLTQSREIAEYFEDLVARLGKKEARLCANWIMGELSGALNRHNLDIAQSPVSSGQLAGLLLRFRDNTLSGKMAKEVFEAMWAGEGSADEIIDKRGLKQISDAGAIEKIVDQVLTANAKQAEDYRAGKEKAFNSLVGQVMKATQGKANPAQVNEILRRKRSVRL